MMGIQIYKYLIKNTSRNHQPPSHLFSSTFLSPITPYLSYQSSPILSSLIHHLEEMRLDILSQFNEIKNKGLERNSSQLFYLNYLVSSYLMSSHFISYLEYDFIDFWPFVLSLGRFVNGREFAQKIQTDHKMWEIIYFIIFHFFFFICVVVNYQLIILLSYLNFVSFIFYHHLTIIINHLKNHLSIYQIY